MNKLLAKKTLVALVLLLVLGGVGWVIQARAADDDSRSVTSIFGIEGMTCGGCELGVKMKINKLDGVESVEASYKDGKAKVVYDPNRVTPDDIIAAIEDLGYTAELVQDDRAELLKTSAALVPVEKPSALKRLLASCC